MRSSGVATVERAVKNLEAAVPGASRDATAEVVKMIKAIEVAARGGWATGHLKKIKTINRCSD